MLDALITMYGTRIFGVGIEANPYLADNLFMGIVFIKVPSLLLISWVVWNYHNRTKKEKHFIFWVVVALTILICLVVLFNCYLMLTWI